MQTKEYSTDFGGQKLTVEISDLAEQANGSVLVRYGETAVFATATMSKHAKEEMNYFPLMVNYEEKFYAAGRILGGRFMKREGRPSDEAVLTGRLVDRTIRPLFNQKMRHEVQVAILALSVDGKNDTDVPAVIAASLALGISDIPWAGPVGGVRISHIDGKIVVNADYEQREATDLDTVICGRDNTINMIEAEGLQVSEDIVQNAFEKGIGELNNLQKFQEKIIKEIGKEKKAIEIKEVPQEMRELLEKEITSRLDKIIYLNEKSRLNELKKEWLEIAKEKIGEPYLVEADDLYEEKINDIIHDGILDAPDGKEKRPDGRKIDEVRNIMAKTGFLPILHGSGVFYRGGTHVLSVVTLGSPKDGQLIEGMEIQTTKHFMHHYNFPPFSTGETGRMGSPGRREIGHGALAEKALAAVIPSREEFPYTIRLVSESMASNGSTSQGSICASTLALMDAGVPIKNPVAGIAIGLIMEPKTHNMEQGTKDKSSKIHDRRYKILTDIQGPEDHHGDMDFKCAGTKDGVTAIQMDIKVDGVTLEILKDALDYAKKARMKILETMLAEIPEPRKELSQYAPRITTMKIDPAKIGEVVGPGGKMINSIIEKTGAEIDIEQDGTIFITSKDSEGASEAQKIIESITHEFEEGEIIEGPVSRLFDFGAMVQIGPKQEGLVHISELAPFRVEKVTDIVKEGQIVKVKVTGKDEKGRINLSLKQADPNYKPREDSRGGDRPRPPRPHGGFRPGGRPNHRPRR